MLTGATGPSQLPTEQREESPRIVSDGASHKREEQKPLNGEDAEASDLSSIAESMEMDYMSTDDDLHDDEETGLTAKQRRQQRRRRRRQRRQLDARIADVKASRKDVFSLGLAERSVLQRLLVNGVLILSWYFFSLSISIVSFLHPLRSLRVANHLHVTVQQMDVFAGRHRIPLSSLHHQLAHGRPVHILWPDSLGYSFAPPKESIRIRGVRLVTYTGSWAIREKATDHEVLLPDSPGPLRYGDIVGYRIGQHVPQIHLAHLLDHVQILRPCLRSALRFYLSPRNPFCQIGYHYRCHDCRCSHDGGR